MQSNFANARREQPAAVLVVGGGIGGMRSALDLADAGLKVYLIEQTSCLGGRVAQLGYMFPQHDCVLCRGTPDHGFGCTRPSISPAYIQNNQHPNIQILTNTRVVDAEGQAGDFTVVLRQEPRYVDPARCINCDRCSEVCPVELPDSYQQALTTRKAAYKMAARASPDAYAIDRGPYCDTCGLCVEACPTGAIDLQEQPRLMSIGVGAIILALGFKVFDPAAHSELGHDRYPNVVNAMQYERLASRSGPTEGLITRPSDGRTPRSIAWLQCIGSRDRQNSYCSSICCMYATKEAILANQRLGAEVDCSIFIMDKRAFNKEHSSYFAAARDKHGIQYNYCRVSEVVEDPSTHDLILHTLDERRNLKKDRFEMVVLATGLQPPDSARYLANLLDIELNEYGFCQTDKFTPLQTSRPGVFVCGAFSSPKEILETIIDASGAAAEAMRLLNDRLNSYPFTRELPFLSTNALPPEIDVSGQEPKVGVFLCSCGSTISQVLNLPALMNQIQKWRGISQVEIIEYACFDESLSRLQSRIQEHGLNRVVVGACSNRTHDPLFQRSVREAGLNPYLLELVNLREQCSKVHTKQPELANRKALELLRLAVGRVRIEEPVHKHMHLCRPSALIIGGGVSGMTSALAIADSGYNVHLIERSDMLGGNLLNLHFVAEGYQPQRLLRDLVNRVRAHKRITTYTRTELIRHMGHVGYFRSTLRTTYPDGSVDDHDIEYGVVIVATGGRETHEYPLLLHPKILTQQELEQKVIHAPEEIASLRHVVMLQCMGSDGVAQYCSRVCCTNTMKNAIRLKLFNPECQVTVLYRDIVTYGFREAYFNEARRLGVVFIRWTDEEPPRVMANGDQLEVHIRDLSLGCWIQLPADLIPMSMTIEPSQGTEKLAKMLRVPISHEGFFAEAQLKLRPMDFMREGVFLAGMAHFPKFIEESISHALAAAARALPLLSQKSLYLGGVVAEVEQEKCVGCLTCTRTCPFQIPQVVKQNGRTGVGDLGGAAFIDPAQCQGCGTCTADCPAGAIQLIDYTDELITLSSIGGLGSWRLTSPEDLVPA